MNRLLASITAVTSPPPSESSMAAADSNSNNSNNNSNNIMMIDSPTEGDSQPSLLVEHLMHANIPSECSQDSEGTEFTANPPRDPVPTAWNHHDNNDNNTSLVMPDYEVTPEDDQGGGGDYNPPSSVGGAGTTIMEPYPVVDVNHNHNNNDDNDDDDDEEEDDEQDDEEGEEDDEHDDEDDDDDEEQEEDVKSAGLSTQLSSYRSGNSPTAAAAESSSSSNKKRSTSSNSNKKKKKTSSNNNSNIISMKPKEVDFYRNPTILSRLILNQRYTNAIHRLRKHPHEASVWVCTKRQLPCDAMQRSSPPNIKRNNTTSSGGTSGGSHKHAKGNRLSSPRQLENTTLVFIQPKAATNATTTTTTTTASAGDDSISHQEEAQYDKLGRSLHSYMSTSSGPGGSITTADIAAAEAFAEQATKSAMPTLTTTTTIATPPKRRSSAAATNSQTSSSSSSPASASSPPPKILSSSSSSPKYYYSLRQLPIHVACSNLFRHGDARLREQLEKLITHLVVVHPDGCMEVDHEGRLPLHEAIWHNCTAATVSILLMAAPETIHARDKYGKSPLELNMNRCAAITNSVGGGGGSSNDDSHLSTISNATAAGVTANNMAMALQHLQEQRRIHDLLQKGVQFWEHAKQEAMLRMKHGDKPVQSSSASRPNAAGYNSSLNASLHSLGVKSVDSISVLAASSLNSDGSNTVWTADQSRDFGRAGSLTGDMNKKKKVDYQTTAFNDAGSNSDRATSGGAPSSAATQRAMRTASTSSLRTTAGNKDDATVEPLAWSQLEQRCLQLEQLLTEMYETNFELGEVIGGLTRKKIELEDELELLVATDFAREAVSMRDDNMNLRKEVVRLQLLLQEHGIQDKQKNYYQNPYLTVTDNTQLEDIDPERRLEVIQYLDAKNRMLQQQVDEWTRSSHKFQRKSEQLEMVINSLHAMEDESVVTTKEDGSMASRSILETLKTDSTNATERYLAKRLTELDDRLAEAKQRSEEEQAVSLEERLRLIRENEALVSELKFVATNSNNNSPSIKEKMNMRAVPGSSNNDFADALDVNWSKETVVIPSHAQRSGNANDDALDEGQQDWVDEELDAIIRETERQTGLKIAPELVSALRQASFRKNSNDSGPLGESSSFASRRMSFSSLGTEQPTLADDELMSLIAAAEKESGLTIPTELISALRQTSLSNASAHHEYVSYGGEQSSSLQGSRSYLARQPQDQPASLPIAAPTQRAEFYMGRSVPSSADEQEAVARPKQNQYVQPKFEELASTHAVGNHAEATDKPKELRSSPGRSPRGTAPAIAMIAAREKLEKKSLAPKAEENISKESDGPGVKSQEASSTVLVAEIAAVRPLRASDAPSVSSYYRQFNDDDLDLLLREIEREFGEPIPPDVVHALRRASTQTMLSSLSEESGIESQESLSHASHSKREFTSLATSTSPLSDTEVDRMLAEAERLLGRPLSTGLIRAMRTASASFATPSTVTYKDESPRSNEQSSSNEGIKSTHQKTRMDYALPNETAMNDIVENESGARNESKNAPTFFAENSADSERDMQNLIHEAEMLYGGPLSPETISALKSRSVTEGDDGGGLATDMEVGEEDIESIIREAERLQGMPLSEDLVNALRSVAFHDDASDRYFRDYMGNPSDKTFSSDNASATKELETSQKVSSSTRRSPKGNSGKLDMMLSTRGSESKASSDAVSRPLQPPERQLSTFTLVSVSSCGSNDLQDISGFEFQGQLDHVSELDEANQDDTDHSDLSDSDLALLIEKAYQSQGRAIPSDLLNAISSASQLQDADDPEDFDGVISEVERLYGKALPNEVSKAVREASQLPHIGDVDELDIVLEEAERMYGGKLSSFVKRAWREPSSSSISTEFVEEAKRIYGNPIPNELSEALLRGVSQSSLDLGIDQELDRIILDAEHMYGEELPSDFISALRQASVRFSSSRFSLRSLLDTMDMPSIAEDSPLNDEEVNEARRRKDDEDGQITSDELHAVFEEAAKMLGTKR